MHTTLKVPSMGVPQCFLKSGCRRSTQQTGWGGGLLSLDPVSGRGWGGVGEGRAQLAPPQQLRGWPAGVPPACSPHRTGSWGWRTNFHSWEKKVREDEPGRVLWPETSATDRAEGMKVGLVGVAQPRLRVSPVLRGPGGERWWGGRALLLLVVVGNTGRG